MSAEKTAALARFMGFKDIGFTAGGMCFYYNEQGDVVYFRPSEDANHLNMVLRELPTRKRRILDDKLCRSYSAQTTRKKIMPERIALYALYLPTATLADLVWQVVKGIDHDRPDTRHQPRST